MSKRFFERNGLIWNSDLPPSERFVLMALNEFSDHEGQNCYPGQQTLAEMTGFTRRTIASCLKSLKVKQLVDWLTNGKRHAKTATNEYRIDFGILEAQFQKGKAQQEVKPPCDPISLGANTQPPPCDPISHPLVILDHTPLRSYFTPPCDPGSHDLLLDLLLDLPNISAPPTPHENGKSKYIYFSEENSFEIQAAKTADSNFPFILVKPQNQTAGIEKNASSAVAITPENLATMEQSMTSGAIAASVRPRAHLFMENLGEDLKPTAPDDAQDSFVDNWLTLAVEIWPPAQTPLSTPQKSAAPSSNPIPPNGWKLAQTLDIGGEQIPVKRANLADLAGCDRKSDLLEIYNTQKPSIWPRKEGLDMGEVIMVEEYETELQFAGNRDPEAARAEARTRLSLALAYMKLKPDYYSQPNARGQELHFRGFNWLFKRSAHGRHINFLAEQAQALNLNPEAILSASSTESGEFGVIPEALLGRQWFQEMMRDYLAPATSPQRKEKLFKLLDFNIQDFRKKHHA